MPPKRKQNTATTLNSSSSAEKSPETDETDRDKSKQDHDEEATFTSSELQRILDMQLNAQTKEFKKILDTYHKGFQEEIKEIKSSQEFLNQKFDELNENINRLSSENKRLLIENESLKSQIQCSLAKATQLEQDQESTNQYLRRECLELHGIPTSIGEDTDDLVCKMAELLEVDLKADDISISHRLPVNKVGLTPPIIAKFARRSVRDKLYQARRNLKNYNSTNLGFDHKNNLYVNESLTPSSRNILKQAKEIQRQFKYQFVWTKNGRVLMKKDYDADPVSFNNIHEFMKFKDRIMDSKDK